MSSRTVALRSIISSVHVVKKSRSRPPQHIKADLTLCYCPSITFSSWLTTFQMSVLVWRGILGSLLISSSIEIAYAARTVSESSRFSSRVLASSAARRMFLGTESSPTMRARISMLCFKMSSFSDIVSLPVQYGRCARQALLRSFLDDPHNI